MYLLRHILYALFYCAVASLVLNDVVRLACPGMQLNAALVACNDAGDEEDNNNKVNPFSTLEEEVKHHNSPERLQAIALLADASIDLAAEHLIKDDEVRHLAFIPIFSPPPDLA